MLSVRFEMWLAILSESAGFRVIFDKISENFRILVQVNIFGSKLENVVCDVHPLNILLHIL